MIAFTVSSLNQVHADFLAALPRILRHAKCCFRHIHCRHRKADCVSEVVSLCWKWWLRVIERGKDPSQFVSVMATFAARAVRCGRRLCGKLKAKDVMNEATQQRRGFTVSKLPDYSTLDTNPLVEALAENTVSPILDQVQVRCDLPAWLRTRCKRDRAMAKQMMLGERTQALARMFKLSEARVSQLRHQFHEDWEHFTGEEQVAMVAS